MHIKNDVLLQTLNLRNLSDFVWESVESSTNYRRLEFS